MKLQFLILVAGAAVAAAAAVDPADIGLITGDERSPLEARFNACDRRCHNGKGHCDNKDQCKKKCHKCVDSGKAFNPAQRCGCISGKACDACAGCEEGCGHLDTDSAIAACYLSCSRDKGCKKCDGN